MGVQYKTTKHSHYEELRCHPLGQHRPRRTRALLWKSPSVHSRVKAAPAPAKTIAGLVVSDSRFSNLLAAVKAAGLVDTLSGAGPFTVFAPTNDAFAKVPQDALTALLADKEALTAVLLRHVVPGAIKAKDVPLGSTTLGTAGGEEIVVTNGPSGVAIKSSAGSANVIIFDVLASNGVVHAVDSVF